MAFKYYVYRLREKHRLNIGISIDNLIKEKWITLLPTVKQKHAIKNGALHITFYQLLNNIHYEKHAGWVEGGFLFCHFIYVFSVICETFPFFLPFFVCFIIFQGKNLQHPIFFLKYSKYPNRPSDPWPLGFQESCPSFLTFSHLLFCGRYYVKTTKTFWFYFRPPWLSSSFIYSTL